MATTRTPWLLWANQIIPEFPEVNLIICNAGVETDVVADRKRYLHHREAHPTTGSEFQ